MLEKFAHFLLKKRSNAALVALLCGILPTVLASISAIVVALVTLKKGEREGFFVLAWGILPFLAQAFVAKSYLFFATTTVAFVLVWGMAAMLRHYASWGLLLDVAALLGVGIVLILHAFQANIVQWWANHISHYLHMVVNAGYFEASDIPSRKSITAIAQLSTGVEVLLLMLLSGFKVALARWWEGRVFKTCHFREEILRARFSRWLLLLFVLLLLIAVFFKTFVFVDALLPLAGLYAVTGLCVLHFWLQGYKYARSALLGFYVVLIIFPYMMALVLILGLVDSGINLRDRIQAVHN